MNFKADPNNGFFVRSIPTEYGGILFRSKLEADHARFFDNKKIKWAYESEGFDLNGLWYLPDFWLPEHRVVVEVKGILDPISEEKVFALKRVLPPGTYLLLSMAPVGRNWMHVMRDCITGCAVPFADYWP